MDNGRGFPIRRWSRHILPLFLGALFLLLICTSVEADGGQILESDDFDGANRSAPNATMWDVGRTDSNEHCEIKGNTLWTHSTGNGYAYVLGKDHYGSTNLTLLVDYKMGIRSGMTPDIRIYSNDSIRNRGWIMISYDGDAGSGTINYRYGGREVQWAFYQDFAYDKWYTVNITVMVDSFDFVITERDTGTTFLSLPDRDCDPLGPDNYVHIGVFQYHNHLSADAYFDDYRLYDVSPHVNRPPEWGDLPVLEAVEDVPITYDFTANVSDPDDNLANLSLNSTSDYVVSIYGFNVTFLFPEGVTEATVALVLTDGKLNVTAMVEFTIQPVNDPPSHIIPYEMHAVEDVPYTVDLTTFLWDVDNLTTDLTIEVDDPYASAEGRRLTVLFPEGVLDHYLTVYVSDGIDTNGTIIHFIISPVDDPPMVAPLGEVMVIEDTVTTHDLAPFIQDIDTPIDNMTVIVRDPNCTVEGLTLAFLCTMGGIRYDVTVEVNDGKNWVRETLTVVIQEVNDAPIIGLIPPRSFVEEEEEFVDLTQLVSDEDTPRTQLRLECDHEAVEEIDGLRLSMLYREWVAPHQVEVAVFDGYIRTYANFSVQVQAVNDGPRLSGHISQPGWPGIKRIDEGGERTDLVYAEDEDDTELVWSIESDFYGFELQGDGMNSRTLRTYAEKGDVGEFFANITVTDPHGAFDTRGVRLRVDNVNDPPMVPTILSPVNGSVFVQGENITFSVSVQDPDIVLGQVLNVNWSNNNTGPMMHRRSDMEQAFVISTLRPGNYRVEVTVSDGEFEKKAWVLLTVEPTPEPKPQEEPIFTVAETIGLILLVITVIIILAIAVVYLSRGKGEGDARPDITADEAPVVAEVPQGPMDDIEWVADDGKNG